MEEMRGKAKKKRKKPRRKKWRKKTPWICFNRKNLL